MGYKHLEYLQGKPNLLVIDNSVIVRWLVGDGSTKDKQLAQSVLQFIQSKKSVAVVPSLWVYEVSYVMAAYIKRGVLDQSDALKRLSMPFEICNIVDFKPSAMNLTISSIELGLSSYDTAYLNLANHLNCPIATLDKKLQKAILKSGGQLFK